MTTHSKTIQKQPLLLLIYIIEKTLIVLGVIQKQPLLLLIFVIPLSVDTSPPYSKTTFVTVNPLVFKDFTFYNIVQKP